MAKTKEEIKEPIEMTKEIIKERAIETKKAEQQSEYSRLENVIDTRNEQFHSVAIVKHENAKFFEAVEQ